MSSGGVDVVLECVGAPTFLPSLKAQKPEGRLVLVGNVSNATARETGGAPTRTRAGLADLNVCRVLPELEV